MTKSQIQGIALSLPEADRLELAEVLWHSVETQVEIPAPLPAWQRELLEARLADSTSDADTVSWDEVRSSLEARRAARS